MDGVCGVAEYSNPIAHPRVYSDEAWCEVGDLRPCLHGSESSLQFGSGFGDLAPELFDPLPLQIVELAFSNAVEHVACIGTCGHYSQHFSGSLVLSCSVFQFRDWPDESYEEGVGVLSRLCRRSYATPDSGLGSVSPHTDIGFDVCWLLLDSDPDSLREAGVPEDLAETRIPASPSTHLPIVV